MTDVSPAAGASPKSDPREPVGSPDLRSSKRQGSIRRYVKFASAFWMGPDRAKAWGLTLAALALVFANLAVTVGFNWWNKWFFDALEKRDGSTLFTAIFVVIGLVAIGAAFAVAMVRTRMTLQIRWRQWLTEKLLARWLSKQRYYRLAVTDDDQVNPEYRMADDLRLASEPVLEFAIGFLNAVLGAITFVSILFVVGGSINLTIGSSVITVPGYVAIAAVIYASVVSALTYFIGSPLVSRVAAKNESEGQFRYELVRVRENAESIALIKGADDEGVRLRETYGVVADRWLDVARQHCHLTWMLNSNAFFAPIFPILLATPKFLAGELSLGSVMQLAAAFTAVLAALNWFAENYIRLAEWSASAKRIDELLVALDDIDVSEKEARIVIENSSAAEIRLVDLSIVHRDGRVVVDDADITVAPGDRVLLGGESGSGKSTLIRAVAGLWPWGEGRILLPEGAKVAFVPQRPYIPLGSLREVLAYPAEGKLLSTDRAQEVLRDVGLKYFVEKLDEEEVRWDQTLSGGERQRLAFARLLIDEPDIIIMDEATAALDVDSEFRLLSLLFSRLEKAAIFSVGHRPGLQELHSRLLTLQRRASGGRIIQTRTSDAKPWRRRVKSAAMSFWKRQPQEQPPSGVEVESDPPAAVAREPDRTRTKDLVG